MIKSLPYQPFLIESLKDPIDSAFYINVFFEEKDPEPVLLKMVLADIAEALAPTKMTDEQAKLHREKLDVILAKPGSEAIYDLAQWLQELGLKLTVTVASNEPVADDELTKELVTA